MRVSPITGILTTFFISAVWAAGCGSTDATAIDPPPGGGGGDGVDSGNGGNGGGFGDGGDSPDGSRPPRVDGGGGSGDFCKGTGAAIPVPGGDICTGDLGRKLFKFAACSCTTTNFSGTLTTDSFNSNTGGRDAGPARNGGSIGSNGQLLSTGDYKIGGSAYSGGEGVESDGNTVNFTSGSGGDIATDLWARGNIGIIDASGMHIGRDIRATGKVGSVGVNVGAHVLVPNKSNVGAGVKSAGIIEGPVTVPLPCDCTDKLDVANVVSQLKTKNDNASIHLPENKLEGGGEVTLPCGRYYLSSVGGPGVKIHVEGRVALFVAGDLNVAGAFEIDLKPNTEIDLFVAGNFGMAGGTQFGSPEFPSKVRFYIGGNKFTLAGSSKVGGNFYAPNATISAPQTGFEMSGSIFGNKLEFPGFFAIHYDEAILDLDGCQPPGQTCNSCNDCADACKGGQCGGCQTNADCCAPLTCNTTTGKCISDVH